MEVLYMANEANIKKYQEYFKGILEELEREFKKSEEYAKKIDDEIKKFEGSITSKGTQYYIIEHLKNAIELQAQKQSLIKDKFAIKKAILDYSIKTETNENDGKTIFAELSKIVKIDKQKLDELGKKIDNSQSPEELDRKIDELLENSEEESE
jgi:hypothetical protein